MSGTKNRHCWHQIPEHYPDGVPADLFDLHQFLTEQNLHFKTRSLERIVSAFKCRGFEEDAKGWLRPPKDKP